MRLLILCSLRGQATDVCAASTERQPERARRYRTAPTVLELPMQAKADAQHTYSRSRVRVTGSVMQMCIRNDHYSLNGLEGYL